MPVGNDEKSNKFIEKFGKIKNFLSNQYHTEIGSKTQIDFDTASKLSGSRFVILKSKVALLEEL